MPAPFAAYIASIAADLKGGHATEHTYRPALEHFMEAVRPGVKASNDPKHIACGAPDFIIEKGKVPLGYVETKDVGADLDKVEKSEQIKRYLKALNNLILTDYLEFRWYVNGEKRRVVRVAAPGKNGKLALEEQAALNLEQLFEDFYNEEAPTVASPKELAARLAGVTHFIREQIVQALSSGDPAAQQGLETRLKAFRELLLPAMKPEEFADLYAQAMTYGLFAAKLSTPLTEKFSLLSAYLYLGGNGFLRKLFMDVSEELDEIEIIRPYLQDIVSLLNRADFASILATFGRRTRTEDPVVHFYETFLASYDPKLRESRGVYYTPEPVVQFIVRSVDELLKTRFGKPWGLADSSVRVLDPAAGTGTFLYFVIQQIYEEVVTTRHQAGQWPQVSKALLGRLFGFELLMAPYVVSHLKLGMQLRELGAPLGKHERVQVYLTNALEEGISRAEHLAGLGSYIAEESSEAAQVKKQEDIMVVLGNPPYSNFGMMNKGKWIQNLLEDYKKDLNERKINLDDDFIKFIRFGQWRIDKTGQGILAYITNNTFIDGITHRQMRKYLLKTFTSIYILDLHGSSKKKEKSPDGSKDDNVFDIQQGVSINIFVKDGTKTGNANVYFAEIWGGRNTKYNYLLDEKLSSINWKQLEPSSPNFFFVPSTNLSSDEFNKLLSIQEIFPDSISGVQTKKDDLFVDFTRKDLELKMSTFMKAVKTSDTLQLRHYLENDDHWIILKSKASNFDGNKIFSYMVSPFDKRYVYYDADIIGRARYNIMKHMLNGNNGLVFMRQNTNQGSYDHFFAVESLVTDRIFYSAHGAPFLAPLYIYTTPEETAGTLFAQSETTRKANLSPAFVAALSEKLGIPYVEDPHPSSPKFAAEGLYPSSPKFAAEGPHPSSPKFAAEGPHPSSPKFAAEGPYPSSPKFAANLGEVDEGRRGFWGPEDAFY